MRHSLRSYRQGKAFCERPFALHRQEPTNDMQNVAFAPVEKFLRAPMNS